MSWNYEVSKAVREAQLERKTVKEFIIEARECWCIELQDQLASDMKAFEKALEPLRGY